MEEVNIKVLIRISIQMELNTLYHFLIPHNEWPKQSATIGTYLKLPKHFYMRPHLSSNFWSLSCQHASYLINPFPTQLWNNTSPYVKLFGVSHWYNSLRTFGCLCYPWLKLYPTHKLEPRSSPCVYFGFSEVHHAHQCFDPINSKFYVSHDVKFLENIFPFETIFSHIKNQSFTLTWEDVDTPDSPIQSLSLDISPLPSPLPVRENHSISGQAYEFISSG